MSDTTRELLAILRAFCIDRDVLRDCYEIDLDDPDDAPLERALLAWRRAGYPDAPREPK